MQGHKFLKTFASMCRSKQFNSSSHSFFFAIAFGFSRKRDLIKKAKAIFLQLYPQNHFMTYQPVPFDHEEYLRISRVLRIDLAIYTLFDARGYGKKVSFIHTVENSTKSINLFLYNGVYSFINDSVKFIGLHECSSCEKMFLNHRNLHHHKNKVHNENRNIIKKSRKGAFQWISTLYDKLLGAGVPEKYLENVRYRNFLVFDIESALKDMETNHENVCAYHITAEHVPIAIGVTGKTNNEPKLFVSRSNDIGIPEMIDKFLKYCIRESRKIGKDYRKKNKHLLKYLAGRIIRYKRIGQYSNASRYVQLCKKILSHSKVLPIIGYNSSRYDIPVLQYYGFFALLIQRDGMCKII